MLPLVTLNSVRSQIYFSRHLTNENLFYTVPDCISCCLFFNMLLFPFFKEGGRNGWLIRCLHYLSWTKKTMIVDVIIVNSVMWAEGWERGEWGKSQRVGQLLPDRGPEWMGIRHNEQETGPPSKLGFLVILQGVE